MPERGDTNRRILGDVKRGPLPKTGGGSFSFSGMSAGSSGESLDERRKRLFGDSGGKGPASLLEQFTGTLSAVPGGLIGLGQAFSENTIGLGGAALMRYSAGRSADEVRSDRTPVLGALGRFLTNEEAIEAFDDDSVSLGDKYRAAAPFFHELGASGSQTAGRLTDLAASAAPGGKAFGDNAYSQASRDGRILPLLIEDVGNVSIVGGTGAKLLKGAGAASSIRAAGSIIDDLGRVRPAQPNRLFTAAEKAQRGFRRLEDVADAPITGIPRIPSLLHRYVTGEGSLARPGARVRSGQGIFEALRETERFQRSKPGQMLSKFGQRRDLQDVQFEEQMAYGRDAEIIGEAVRQGSDIPAEVVAARLVDSGMIDALGDVAANDRAIAGLVESPWFRTTVRELDPKNADAGQAIAREAFDIADQHRRGELDPEVAKRVDATAEQWRNVSDMLGDRAREHMDPALFGDEILPHNVGRFLSDYASQEKRLFKDLEKQTKRATRAEARLTAAPGTTSKGLVQRWQKAQKVKRTAASKIVKDLGVREVADLLDIELKHAPTTAKAVDTVTEALVDHLEARLIADEQGLPTPDDWLTDAFGDLEQYERVPFAGASQVGLTGLYDEAGRAGVAEAGAAKADRLFSEMDDIDARIEQKVVDLENRINELAQQKGPVADVLSAGRKSGAMRAKWRRSLRSVERARKTIQERGTFTTAELDAQVKDIRDGLTPVVEPALKQAMDDAWHHLGFLMSDMKLRLSKANDPNYADFTEPFLSEIGMTPKQIANQYPAFFAFGDAGKGWDVVADALEARGLLDDAQIDTAVSTIAEAVKAHDSARRAHSQWSTPQRGHGGGYKPAGRTLWRRGELGVDDLASDVVEAYVQALGDADYAFAALEGPDALRTFYETEQVGDWVNLAEDAAGQVHNLIGPGGALDRWITGADVDVDLPDINPADRIEALGSAEVTRAVDRLRDEWVERTGISERDRTLRTREWDRARAELEAEIGDLNAGRRAQESMRGNRRTSAERGAVAGRKLGQVEGRRSIVAREAANAESQAMFDPLRATEARQSFTDRQRARAYKEGFEESGRQADYRKQMDKLTKLELELADLQGGFDEGLRAAMDQVTSAPAKYRLALVANQWMSEIIDGVVKELDPSDTATAAMLRRQQSDLVTGAVDMVDMLDDPGFVPGGSLDATGGGFSPPWERKLSEQFTKEGALPGLDARSQFELAMRRLQEQAQNRVARRMLDKYGHPASHWVDNLDGLTGEQIVDAVNERAFERHVAVDPRSAHKDVPVNFITADTLFVPKYLRDQIVEMFQPTSTAEKAARYAIDIPTRLWKHSVLALRPAWHMGNVAGNMLMAWAGGVPPHRQLALIREAMEMRRLETGPFELYAAGPTHDVMNLRYSAILSRDERLPASEFNKARGGNAAQRKVLEKVDPESRLGKLIDRVVHPVDTSYAFNQFVDDITHNIVYLDRIKKGASVDQAVRDSLKVAGNFQKMSKFERRVVRRVLPFYSWMRHITMLSADLAVNHPLRTAWTLHLWTLFSDDDEDYSDMGSMFGRIQTGDNEYISLGNLMPFGTMLDMDLSDPVNTVLQSANPLGKVALYAGTGHEVDSTGLRGAGAPYGLKPVDEFGRRGVFNPIANLIGGDRGAGAGAIFEALTDMFPQARVFRDMARDPVVRYDSGQPLSIDGAQLPDENLTDPTSRRLLRDLLTLPLPRHYDPEALRARRQEELGRG